MYSDILIYGATPAGIIAAITASKHNRSVTLIEPSNHLGGMATGGLGLTDYGKEHTIGGRSRDFYERIGKEYGEEIGWFFEPHVASRVFKKLLKEAGPGRIQLIMKCALDRDTPIISKGHSLNQISTIDGKTFEALQFIDCSYEGDLMASAQVSYRIGRESRDEFNESLAGVLDPRDETIKQPKTTFPQSIDPWIIPGEPESGLLPGIQRIGLPKAGSADDLTQAYNFRVCLTTDPENQIPLSKPARYDAARYELFGRLLSAQPTIPLHCNGWGKRGLLKISPLPGNKTDINDGCIFSTDHIGASFDWPEGSYEDRAQILQDHIDYTKGLLWFIASDPRIPHDIRKEFAQYGYPKDEYLEDDHFSPQLYVREARRLVGSYIMTQQDCWEDIHKEDSIGCGSYGVDSHHVQRLVIDGQIFNEGNFMYHATPYEIPYRAIIPQKKRCDQSLSPGLSLGYACCLWLNTHGTGLDDIGRERCRSSKLSH